MGRALKLPDTKIKITKIKTTLNLCAILKNRLFPFFLLKPSTTVLLLLEQVNYFLLSLPLSSL